MHHHKTYMYINFQQNQVCRSVITVHTNVFAKKSQVSLIPVSHDASVLHDLCSMRDDNFCKMFNKTQLDQLIIDISIN